MDSFSACQFSWSMPSTNRLGSNVGLETSASTSPFLGSSATSAPRRSPNRSSTIFCRRMSSDSMTVLPGVAGWLSSRRTAWPPAEVSSSSTPVCPCSVDSKLCSTPSLPM